MVENTLTPSHATTAPTPAKRGTELGWGAICLDLGLVLLMAIGVTALDVWWSMLNQAPPRGDDNSHLCTALSMLWNVSAMAPPTRALSLFLLYPNYYPPLTYQVTLGFFGMLGVHPWVPVVSFFPFLLVLGASMYGIGAGLGGRAVALACALATLTSPVVLVFSRTYYLDMPAAALLALSLCALLYSRNFTRHGWSALFGISMALGILSKWTHPIFILPFLVVAAARALRDMYAEIWPSLLVGLLMCTSVLLLGLYVLHAPARIDGTTLADGPDFSWTTWIGCALAAAAAVGALQWRAREYLHLRTLANLLEAFALAVLIAWPWYDFNGDKVRYKIVYQANVVVDATQALQSYLGDMSAMLYGAPVLVLIGIGVGLYRPVLRIWTGLLVACVALSVGLATRLPPDSRYILPVVAFLVPLSLVWTSHLSSPRSSPGWRRAAVVLQAAVLLVVCGVGLWRAVASLEPGQATPPLRAPERGHYPYDAVLSLLRSRQTGLLWVAVLESGDDAAALQPRSFLYEAALRHLDLIVIETAEALEHGGEVHDIEQARQFLVIYRDPTTRGVLMREAWARGWISRDARPLGSFEFSPDFHLEVYQAEAAQPLYPL